MRCLGVSGLVVLLSSRRLLANERLTSRRGPFVWRVRQRTQREQERRRPNEWKYIESTTGAHMTLRLKVHDDKEKYPMSESEAPLS